MMMGNQSNNRGEPARARMGTEGDWVREAELRRENLEDETTHANPGRIIDLIYISSLLGFVSPVDAWAFQFWSGQGRGSSVWAGGAPCGGNIGVRSYFNIWAGFLGTPLAIWLRPWI